MNRTAVHAPGYMAAWIITLILFSSNAFPAQGVSIVHEKNGTTAGRQIPLSRMLSNPVQIHTLDPNFISDGRQTYTGIELGTLLGMAGCGPEDFSVHGVTVAGSDQYICFLPYRRLTTRTVFLAWETDSRLISPVRGGPLKIIYTTGTQPDPNCYTWYVSAVFVGRPQNPGLSVQQGSRKTAYTYRQLTSISEPIDFRSVSLPAGCRGEYPGAVGDFQAVGLSRLLDLGVIGKNGTVAFIPWVGSGIVLDNHPALARIQIVVSMSENPVHPVFGGPFSVLFPMDPDNGFAGRVPDTGALFYVKEIVVR